MSNASIYLKAKVYLEVKYTYTYIYSSLKITFVYFFSNVNLFVLFTQNFSIFLFLFFLKKEGADGCSKQTVHNMSGDVLCYLPRVDYN